MTRPTTTEGGAAPAWEAILAMTSMELRLAPGAITGRASG